MGWRGGEEYCGERLPEDLARGSVDATGRIQLTVLLIRSYNSGFAFTRILRIHLNEE
jgi:hypothetical protein